ncbi:PIN domain-containing protein [Bradyrhizobium sp. SZCCHNR1098]|uniref:PIN domain-containing protein n=1 Tax=Bradyrhizobium sp. SZCCHNR1098 TaxID=3057370 RepID=UPI002915CB79|nr:PIN domain-containing protein [Bradyrhizobium sp. SZCCHNR1098]
MIEPGTQLETKFVFLDTEAFVREKFDWNSKALSRLVELANSNHIRLLTTTITKAEICNKLREHLTNASSALKKYEILLLQLAPSNPLAATLDDQAYDRLEELLDDFLSRSRSIEVPLDIDVNAVFEDYFQQRPPFSNKKKSEFPDAVVVHALRRWCNSKFCKAYVVSADPDMKACCDDVLLHSETVSEIISKATVTKKIHDELLAFIKRAQSLKEKLSAAIIGKPISILNPFRGIYHHDVSATGTAYGISNLEIYELNVLSERRGGFSCEINFDARVDIELEMSFGESYTGFGYERGRTYFESESVEFSFIAEIFVAFDLVNPSIPQVDLLDFNPLMEVGLRELDIYRSLR